MNANPARDIEKAYSVAQTAAKLRRLAACLERGRPFRTQIAGERVTVPADAVFSVEHEREDGRGEIEFQFKWAHAPRYPALPVDPPPGSLPPILNPARLTFEMQTPF